MSVFERAINDINSTKDKGGTTETIEQKIKRARMDEMDSAKAERIT